MKKCPSCGSTDLVNDFGTYECNDCGHDSDMFHFELQAENDKLREALEYIVNQTNHVSIDSEEASMMIYIACNTAKKALEYLNAKA